MRLFSLQSYPIRHSKRISLNTSGDLELLLSHWQVGTPYIQIIAMASLPSLPSSSILNMILNRQIYTR
jgi:hypothetical protein